MNESSGKPANDTKRAGMILLLISLSLTSFMTALDGTIVNVALPTISQAFDTSTSTTSWVSTAYLLVIAGCILVIGKLSLRVGAKKMFLLGYAIFSIGSLCCGILPAIFGSIDWLVLSRIFQAVGGAMMTAMMAAMIARYIPLEKKGQSMGIVMTVASLGMSLGPTIGGILTEYLTWEWIFYINVPIGIAGIILGMKSIPSDKKDADAITVPFDLKGSVLIFTGMSMLLFWISEGSSFGWTSPVILLTLIVGAVSLVLFYITERKSKDPILDFKLFENRDFLMINVFICLLYMTYSGINYLLPYYLEYVQGHSVSNSGLILTALSFSLMIAGLISGSLLNKTGGRKLTIAGASCLLLGLIMITSFSPTTDLLYTILSLALIGFGLGISTSPSMTGAVNSVSKSQSTMVSSITSLERFAPMTVGVALFNLIFIEAMSFIGKRAEITTMPAKEIIVQYLSNGFDISFIIAAIIGVIILIVALITKHNIHSDYINDNNREIAKQMMK